MRTPSGHRHRCERPKSPCSCRIAESHLNLRESGTRNDPESRPQLLFKFEPNALWESGAQVSDKSVVAQFEFGSSAPAQFGKPQWTHFLANELVYNEVEKKLLPHLGQRNNDRRRPAIANAIIQHSAIVKTTLSGLTPVRAESEGPIAKLMNATPGI
jgi:hypothetical protein